MTHYISKQSDVDLYPNNEHYQFFDDQVEKGVWKQAKGIDLFYAFAFNPQAKACVVISVGRAEAVTKYAEFIYELYQNNYTVFIFDHQGQGGSSRALQNRQIGYVANFTDYVDDLDDLLQKVLAPLLNQHQQQNLPKYLIGHSMGGAIGTLYVQRYPKVFHKLVLSSPMFGIATPLPEWIIQIIVAWAVKLRKFFGVSAGYVWGQGDYQAYPFAGNRLTNSEIRYRVFREVMANYPDDQLGGISFDWLLQAIIAMQELRAQAKNILLPCLILQAQREQVVDNKLMHQVAQIIPDCEFVKVANAQHEILFEEDPARTFAMTKILDFLKAN